MIVKPEKTAIYDGDAKNRSLAQFYATRDAQGGLIGDPLTSVGAYIFGDERARTKFVSSTTLVRSHGVNVLLHDLPGDSLTGLMELADGGKGTRDLMDTLDEAEVRTTLLLGIDNEIESMKSAGAYIKAFGNRVDYLAMLNMRESKSVQDFPYWYGYTDEATDERKYGKVRDDLLALGGVECEIPVLHPWTRSRMNAEGLTFHAAVSSRELSMLERRHVIRFRREFREAIESNPKTLEYFGLNGSSQPRMLVTCSLKGGVGKTFGARALTDVFRSPD